MRVEEIQTERVLCPTGIDLAEYVINPYRGCAFGCLFCYAQGNTVSRKDGRRWGSYVQAKVNACEVLRRELDRYRPQRVLIGSTTECFQPAEAEFHLTAGILSELNRRKIAYTIMTRSPLIVDSLAVLDPQLCARIYFTIDCLTDELRDVLCPHTPRQAEALVALGRLHRAGIPVTAYLCPVAPEAFAAAGIFRELPATVPVECELLNFRMTGWERLSRCLEQRVPAIAAVYAGLRTDPARYEHAQRQLCDDIRVQAGSRTVRIHVHQFGAYFQNRYQSSPSESEKRGIL